MDDPSALDRAEHALGKGLLVVLPTDTVYGIACLAGDRKAVERLFAAKDRETDAPFAVLVASTEVAEDLAEMSDVARDAVTKGWPGPLTVVVPRKAAASNDWWLGDDDSTIGLRVPNYPWLQRLLERTGPLAASSANLSGRPHGSNVDEVAAQFGDSVELYVDAGPIESEPSQVISVVGEVRRLR